MITANRVILAVLLCCVATRASAGFFSLEVVEPASQIGDVGTLRILYDGGEENLSFAVGGLDLKLSSSSAGVIKFVDAEILNDDSRWDVALARDITDNEIGDLFTASLFSPGLAPGPQVFAEVKYSRVGAGFTDVLLDVGGEDPLYQGDRGDVSSHVRSRGVCIGDCTLGAAPTEINLGDSWAILKQEFERQRAIAFSPLPSLPPSVDPRTPPAPTPGPIVPPSPEIIDEPLLDDSFIDVPIVEPRLAHPAQPGVFSLEIVEAATTAGDKGKLRVIYDGGPDGYAFVNGGIHLKLTSSNPSLLEFSNVEIISEDNRWAATVVRDEATAPELFAASLLTPGLAGAGPQIFAEMEYGLLAEGAADLVLDVGGEDPLIDGSWGDVSEIMLSRGVCVGNCTAGTPPIEINLGDSWAALREQLYAPPVQPTPQPTPPSVTPGNEDSPVAPPTWDPDPIDPVLPDSIDDPPANVPVEEIDSPGDVPSVIEIELIPTQPLYGTIDIDELLFPVWQDLTFATPIEVSQFVFLDGTHYFTRNGQLLLDNTGIATLATTASISNLANNSHTLATLRRLHSLSANRAALGALVPEPHSLLAMALLGVGIISLRHRFAR